MAAYDVYVQDKFYKRIEADYTHHALTQVTLDIQDNLVPDYDETQPPRIALRPVKTAPAFMPKTTSTPAS